MEKEKQKKHLSVFYIGNDLAFEEFFKLRGCLGDGKLEDDGSDEYNIAAEILSH